MNRQMDWLAEGRLNALPTHPPRSRYDKPLARATDSETSHAAAERAETFKGKHEAIIFSAIADHADGLTYREIAALTGLEPVAVGRRIKGLRDTAGVYADGTRDGMQVWKVRK